MRAVYRSVYMVQTNAEERGGTLGLRVDPRSASHIKLRSNSLCFTAKRAKSAKSKLLSLRSSRSLRLDRRLNAGWYKNRKWTQVARIQVVRRELILLATLTLLHSLLYIWLVPPWQIPDEPSQFEYAALIAAHGRVPTALDSDPAIDARMVESLLRSHFFEYATGQSLQQPVKTMDDVRAIAFMPRQVGADPPLYFLLAALPMRALADRPIEQQLMAARLVGALCTLGAVLCAYAAGRELFGGARGMALAVGLAVALQPMFVFIGTGVGDDTLANLLGAALCWAIIRATRRGLNARRVAAILLLALLGLFTKRTLLPWVLLLALVGMGLMVRQFLRAPLGRLARIAIGGVALLALVGGTWAALAAGRDQHSAAEWINSAARAPAPRVLSAPVTGQVALQLSAGQDALQGMPQVAMEWAQNQELHLSARVWATDAPAHGRLVIDYGWGKTETPFDATKKPRTIKVHTFIPLFCPYLVVGLVIDKGTLYTDRIGAQSDRQRDVRMLDNGDLAAPGVRYGSLQDRLTSYLRLRELGWAWRSGWLLGPPPLGWALPRIFFGSFWGQFGWMSLPMVIATGWERALMLLCGGGLLGVLGWVAGRTVPVWRRRVVALLLAVLLIGLLFPLLNAYTQSRGQAIQQGRYLFPMLVPLILLLVAGWNAFVPPRWRTAALVLWASWWALFALAALGVIVSAYYPQFAQLRGLFG